MGRRGEFDRGGIPSELAHMFNESEDYEWSVVPDRAVPKPGEPRTRHGVYRSPGEAELHIAKLRVSGGVQPNLKVIMQPQGTAYRDLMEGRIKMLKGADWPAAPKKRKN